KLTRTQTATFVLSSDPFPALAQFVLLLKCPGFRRAGRGFARPPACETAGPPKTPPPPQKTQKPFRLLFAPLFPLSPSLLPFSVLLFVSRVPIELSHAQVVALREIDPARSRRRRCCRARVRRAVRTVHPSLASSADGARQSARPDRFLRPVPIGARQLSDSRR